MTLEYMGAYALLGTLIGFLSGLLGIGGAVFLVPVLVFIFGLSQHLAQGTTLALMVPPIFVFAAIQYYKEGHVCLRVASMLGLGFLGGGYFGAELGTSLSNYVLEKAFGVALLLIAIRVLTMHDPAEDKVDRGAVCPDRLSLLRGTSLMMLGAAVGVVSGVIGIGGGVLLIPCLVMMFGLSQKEAQGTTLALMVPPIGFPAAWDYYHQGDVNLTIAGLMIPGFAIASLLGAQLATRLHSHTLSRVFAVGMLAVSAKMLLGV